MEDAHSAAVHVRLAAAKGGRCQRIDKMKEVRKQSSQEMFRKTEDFDAVSENFLKIIEKV